MTNLHEEYKKRYTILDSMTVYGVGVDSGLIVIADLDYFKKREGYEFEENLSSVHDIDPGEYHVDWSIKDTWNGPVEGSGILKVTSGKVVVSDPCYLVQDTNGINNWGKMLDETDDFKSPPDGMLVLNSMGGDGCYDVNIKLRKI
jgi:hypothetical protein